MEETKKTPVIKTTARNYGGKQRLGIHVTIPYRFIKEYDVRPGDRFTLAVILHERKAEAPAVVAPAPQPAEPLPPQDESDATPHTL